MKVAMMVRGFLATPPPNDIAYSPATIAQSVAEGLQKRGHEVTFYGPEGTKLDVAQVISDGTQPIIKTEADFDDFLAQTDLFETYRPSLYDLRMAKNMLENAKKGLHDVVIFNHFESSMALASLYPTVPIVYVLHDSIDAHRRQVIEMFSSPNQHFISISDNQRTNAPDLNYLATVHNGIDTDLFTPDSDHEDYLMIAGRITAEKGIKEAIQVAKQTERRLLIAGHLSRANGQYFDDNIKPYLDNKILFLGTLNREQLAKYYKKAAALLMPIQWQEPFGLVMAEAASCGTPVIAFNRGAAPEIVEDGKTGFIVSNSAEMIMSIDKLSSIKRKYCHDYAVRNFSLENMITGYETALATLLSKKTVTPPKTSKVGSALRKKVSKISKRLIDGTR